MTESLLDRVPVGNLRVPRAEFGALWVEAERLNDEQAGRPDPDWYPAAVAVTCRVAGRRGGAGLDGPA